MTSDGRPYRPITRLDVIGGYSADTTAFINPTGDTPCNG